MPLQPTMPASRNSTLKTERTHEENQERAYIAASHRTDRSLEARMESARRASEIHKQRTGRSYKITEEAVMKGDVYMDDEEELPAPYQQLDQYLRNDADDFRKRLVDYLTVNVNLRRALSSAIEESTNNASANAAEAQSKGSNPTSSGFQEGSFLGQGIHTTSFSPTVFIPQYQGPITFTTELSNPPIPTAAQAHSKANMAQFQPPVTAHGTQFYMGPVGLGTLPPHYYQGTQFARRQTAPAIRIPQQAPANTASMGQHPYYSAVLSPEQFHALSQTIPNTRRQSSSADMACSPSSDVSMTSFRTGPNPATPKTGSGSPDSLASRRMSVSSKILESPLRTTTLSPHLQHQFPTDSANIHLGVPRSTKLKTLDLGNQALAAEGNANIPHSPAVKRRASTDLTTDQPSTKSVRIEEGSPVMTSSAQKENSQTAISEPDYGFFDLSLPQNAKDILYGPGMFLPGHQALAFAGLTQNLDGKQMVSASAPTISDTIAPSLVSTPNFASDGADTPTFHFSDHELDLTGSLMDPNATNPLTFGMSFSKYDSFEPTGNIDDMWRDYFLQRGVQTGHANTGDAPSEPVTDSRA